MTLRAQDPVPDWVTHIALVQGAQVSTGARRDVLPAAVPHVNHTTDSGKLKPASTMYKERKGRILVDMNRLSVQYQDRKVSFSVIFIFSSPK